MKVDSAASSAAREVAARERKFCSKGKDVPELQGTEICCNLPALHGCDCFAEVATCTQMAPAG